MTKFFIICFLCVRFSVGIFAQRWQYLGLGTESITTIAVDWSDSNTIFAGSGSDFSAGTVGGIFKSTNGGASWDTLIRGVTTREIVIHPNNPDIIYATLGLNVLTIPGIIKTNDGGVSWARVDSGIRMSWEEGPGPIAIDSQHPDTIYTGTGGPFGGRPYKSTDGGLHWYIIDPDSDWVCDTVGGNVYCGNPLRGGITAIAIDPLNTNIIYVGTADNGNVFKSGNGGNSWIDTGLQAFICTIEFSKKTSAIYMGGYWTNDYPVGLFRITDNDSIWENLTNGLPDTLNVSKIQILDSPEDEQVFIACRWRENIGGVYQSINGNRWEKIGTINEPVNTITLNGRKLYAGGSGIYVLNGTSSILDRTTPLPICVHLHDNFPNPFNLNTTIAYEISSHSKVLLEIYDIKGSKIKTILNKEQPSGKYSITWNSQNDDDFLVSSGVYFYVLRTKGQMAAKKLVILR